MKTIRNAKSEIFRTSIPSLIGLSAAFILIAIVLVFTQRSELKQASVINTIGEKENITLPFNSRKDGLEGIYTYEITIRNSRFFSGKFHVIPDDCIEEIVINGIRMTYEQFPKGDCDCVNGFYLDVKSFLNEGDNHLQMKISNTHGFYGLNIIDSTFYEGYVLCGYLLFLLCFINFNTLFRLVAYTLKTYLKDNKLLINTFIFQVLLFMATLISSLYLNYLTIWFWCLVMQLLLLVIFPAAYFVYHEFRFGKVTAIVWIGMILLFIVYLLLLSHTLFSYDYQGHVDYVHYLVNYGEVPLSNGGWSFYHPSLYYRFTAALWNVLNANAQMSNIDFIKTIQASSLLVFILYCYWSLKTIDLFFKHLYGSLKMVNEKFIQCIHVLTIVLFLCWPLNSIVSVRVGNDVMFDLLYALSFYFMLKWWHSNKMWPFFLALLFAALGIWSKTNGFILFGVIGALLIYKYLSYYSSKYREHEKMLNIKYLYKFIFLSLFSVLSLYYSFGEKFESYNTDPKTRLVVGNANGLGSDLLVESGWQSYTTFNIVKFVQTPFTSSYDDNKGRNSFWFFLMKSSLFGEFNYDAAPLALIAQLLSFLFLFLLAMSLAGLTVSIYNMKDYLPIIVGMGIMICSMMIFRVFYPYSSSSDFRYIYPAIMPALLFAGRGWLLFYRVQILFYTGTCVYILFIVLAFTFQVFTIINYGKF